MTIDRRTFLKAAGTASVFASAPGILRAAPQKSRVVVIGGGFGGATAAKYLRLWSNNSIDVTLVDANAQHTSCVMSNLVLNERLNLGDLRFAYSTLSDKYGVTVLTDVAEEIDGHNQQVLLRSSGWVAYDHLILATGISFNRPLGWDPKQMPHAWIAGGQTNLLKRQLDQMPAGGTFVMTIPKSPYRCPPGPYERACLVADILKRRGGGKVVVLDANDKIQAEPETFGRAFDNLYDNIVEYHTGVEIGSLDSEFNAVETNRGKFIGDVVNIIPDQRATRLVREVGLTNGGSWAPVDPLTYESTLGNFPSVHIIGDSQGTEQPKSGHMANAQAKVCVDAILRLEAGMPTDTPERRENVVTNSACYSPITYDQASWLTAVFGYDAASSQMKLTHIGEAGNWTRENYDDMFSWADNLFADTFG